MIVVLFIYDKSLWIFEQRVGENKYFLVMEKSWLTDVCISHKCMKFCRVPNIFDSMQGETQTFLRVVF